MPIHPDYAQFAADPRNTVRPPPPHVALTLVRAAADAAMIDASPPAVHTVLDLSAPAHDRAVPMRLYRPYGHDRLPVIVFVHGGGFVWGSIQTHDGICRRLCIASGVAVVSIGYRLAPETRYPGAVLDVHAALTNLRLRGAEFGLDMSRYAMCGDSAGGNLALAATAQDLLCGHKPSHLALVYPAIDPACDTESFNIFKDGPVLTREAMRWFWSCYLQGTDTKCSILHSPLNASLSGFPPTWIGTAEFDPLRDEGEALAEHLAASGVPVTVERYLGAVHGFLSLPTGADMRDTCITDLSRALRTALETVPCP